MDLSISLCIVPTFLMRLFRKCRSVRPVIRLWAVSPKSLEFLEMSASSSMSSICGSGWRAEGGVEGAELVVVELWDVAGLGVSSVAVGLKFNGARVAIGLGTFGWQDCNSASRRS